MRNNYYFFKNNQIKSIITKHQQTKYFLKNLFILFLSNKILFRIYKIIYHYYEKFITL